MDLSDQRMACLRMAMDLNCNTEPLLKAASGLMAFIASGDATPAVEVKQEEQPAAEASALVESLTPAEPAIDPIAACGTALQMPESGELADAEAVATNSVGAAVEAASEASTGEAGAVAAPEVEAIAAEEATAEAIAEEAPAVDEPETVPSVEEPANSEAATGEATAAEPVAETEAAAEVAVDDAAEASTEAATPDTELQGETAEAVEAAEADVSQNVIAEAATAAAETVADEATATQH